MCMCLRPEASCTIQEWKCTVGNHLETSSVIHRQRHVQAAEFYVGRHAGSCLSAPPCRCDLNLAPTPSRNSCSRAMPKTVEQAATCAQTGAEKKEESLAAQEAPERKCEYGAKLDLRRSNTSDHTTLRPHLRFCLCSATLHSLRNWRPTQDAASYSQPDLFLPWLHVQMFSWKWSKSICESFPRSLCEATTTDLSLGDEAEAIHPAGP